MRAPAKKRKSPEASTDEAVVKDKLVAAPVVNVVEESPKQGPKKQAQERQTPPGREGLASLFGKKGIMK